MFANHDAAIFGCIAANGCIPAARLESIRAEALAAKASLADTLVAHGAFEKSKLLATLASELGYGFQEETPAVLSAEVVAELPGSIAQRYGVVPWRANQERLDLLVSDPFGVEALDELTFTLSRSVRFLMADPDLVVGLVQRHYAAGVADLTPARFAATEHDASAAEISARELEAMAGQTPVVRFVDLVLGQAVRDHASDIHLEPFEHDFKIRYRVDGVLHEMSPPPKSLALPITSRLKVLANLNIAERRLPQDGRISFTQAGRTVDLRISTLPTQFGESVVLRVLDPSAVGRELDEIGLPAEVLASVKDVVHRPNGILLVTGPTGSGKTTTLYSALRAINTPDRKLLTAEDPVEYEIEGITQVAVNPATGLTFASALRSFLRQDPEVIMVGEIRDAETAKIAIQASLTGHLVFSTLHTSDAAGAVTRLVDMGIEPFLIASSLEGVLAQRLVRRICPQCRRAIHPTADMLATMEISPEQLAHRSVYSGAGCSACDHTGFHGRMGLFEWLRITEEIRELITTHASTAAIRDRALAQGMRSLRDDGLRAIFAGETTVGEVLRGT